MCELSHLRCFSEEDGGSKAHYTLCLLYSFIIVKLPLDFTRQFFVELVKLCLSILKATGESRFISWFCSVTDHKRVGAVAV